jgi:hypothetical protein
MILKTDSLSVEDLKDGALVGYVMLDKIDRISKSATLAL